MSVSLLELLDTTRLSTIKSLYPVLAHILEKEEDKDVIYYCHPSEKSSDKVYVASSNIDAALAIALSADKYKDMLVQDLQDLFSEDILKLTCVTDEDQIYFDFFSSKGISISITDIYCHESKYPGLMLNYKDVAVIDPDNDLKSRTISRQIGSSFKSSIPRRFIKH